MNIPEEAFDILVIIAIIGAVWTFVIYFTRNGRNFRRTRNKKARKQF
jgi:hypothetical protein